MTASDDANYPWPAKHHDLQARRMSSGTCRISDFTNADFHTANQPPVWGQTCW